jgi:hypothetical protein
VEEIKHFQARLAVIRQGTHTGRPLGTEQFIQDLATEETLVSKQNGM